MGQQNAGRAAVPAVHRYLALDALRGAAAVAVLFYHLRHLHAADRPNWADGMFASGYLAVDLFFVLSGFVIAHAYDERLGRTMTTRDFLIARIIRLQPVIAIGGLIGFAVALAERLLGLPGAPGLLAMATSLPLNLMMLPNVLLPWGIFLFNPPAWSLFYELVANGLYALGGRKRRTGNMQGLAALVIGGFAGLAISVMTIGSLDRGVDLQDWPVAIARIAFSFTLGLLLHRTRGRWTRHMLRLPLLWLLIACLVLLAPDLSGTVRQLYDLAFAVVFSPLLVMLGAVTSPGPRSQAGAIWLGLISYPLYAVHAPIKHFAEAFLPLPFFGLLVVTLALALACAWFIAMMVDPPIRRWLSALAHARLQAPPPVPPASHRAGRR